jgi:hypothetical protein
MEAYDSSEYILKIDFEKGSEHPERVFKAMSEMISALHFIDKNLINSFVVKIEPKLILEDIETGSLKARIRSLLNLVDDDALKELDWKKEVGSFLVKGKHRILKSLEDKKEISNREQIQKLEDGLLVLAQETDIQQVPFYTTIPTQKFLENLSRLYNATNVLLPQDTVKYISSEGEVTLNQGFNISAEAIEDLLTRETIDSKNEMIFRVKKPDYLGFSKWEVQYKGKTIQVKILDLDWLNAFQDRKIDVRPGDSIRAEMVIEVKYGYDNNVVAEHYTAVKILDILRTEKFLQSDVFEQSDNEERE